VVERQLLQLAADHEMNEPALVEARDGPLADDNPVAEHGHTIGEGEDLVQAVRDEHGRDAASLQGADRSEQ
jgi:hypothetical protein